ncbi:hypothetical protein [Marvinbryantia formatexigens]|uniref:hypothetical protein n=1 Tax=Marvinbryantia formatexigens TaxID=168384 RepID=UPI002E8DF2E2|nr:hypothetical protein [Marvinbryantia formatexigens]
MRQSDSDNAPKHTFIPSQVPCLHWHLTLVRKWKRCYNETYPGFIFSSESGKGEVGRNMFGRKKAVKKEYDRQNQKPVLHCSICTGETVAGFKDLRTGKFEEVMLIKGAKDLAEFKSLYGIEEIAKEY